MNINEIITAPLDMNEAIGAAHYIGRHSSFQRATYRKFVAQTQMARYETNQGQTVDSMTSLVDERLQSKLLSVSLRKGTKSLNSKIKSENQKPNQRTKNQIREPKTKSENQIREPNQRTKNQIREPKTKSENQIREPKTKSEN